MFIYAYFVLMFNMNLVFILITLDNKLFFYKDFEGEKCENNQKSPRYKIILCCGNF